MKVAIVHDWLTNLGGAEKVLRAICDLFPGAPIYTIVYNEKRMGGLFSDREIIPSKIQRFPFAKTQYTKYLPFMPKAVEAFDLSSFDLVISSSTSCAKGVLTGADTLHLCYCATPMRYAWDFYFEYLGGSGRLMKALIPHFMHKVRIWDYITHQRVDYFMANSRTVQRRIQKHYGRDSEVVYPFVDTDFFVPGQETGDFYLIVSRLVPYKRIDLAIEAFNELQLPLVIIGDGGEFQHLSKIAGPTIKLLGRQPDDIILQYYQTCRGFVFPGYEDFGITPLEAQSCGRGVIAYNRGGATETVVDGITGCFFETQTADSLKEAVLRYQKLNLEKDRIRENAQRFSKEHFQKHFMRFVEEKTDEFWRKRK